MDSQFSVGDDEHTAANTSVVGRLAPSPTGALHLGNARSFLLAWLSARQRDGRLILRIEDIDSPRIKPWATQSTIEDLRWLGLDWDVGPECSLLSNSATQSKLAPLAPPPSATSPSATSPSATSPSATRYGGPFVQTQRLDRYREVLRSLISAGCLYTCRCSRSDVQRAVSAPHDAGWKQLEGVVYPGTCRGLQLSPDGLGTEFAWRWAFQPGIQTWNDGLRGGQSAHPDKQLGDFVIAKGDGTPAYQLAVVIDDFDMGVSEVVRGDDLVFSTYRQIAILDHLKWPRPAYFHVPLMVGPDGRRLAKRHGDTRLSYLRKQGIASQAVVGYLAFTAGILPELQPACPAELIGRLDWGQVSVRPTVFEQDAGMKLLRKLS